MHVVLAGITATRWLVQEHPRRQSSEPGWRGGPFARGFDVRDEAVQPRVQLTTNAQHAPLIVDGALLWTYVLVMTGGEVERAALIALLRRASTGWQQITAEVLARGSALRVLDDAVSQRDTLFPETGLVDALVDEAHRLLDSLAMTGIDVRTIFDATYPPQLRDIRELPPVLFTQGRTREDARAIAVIGTRQPTDRGADIARRVATMLCTEEINVVSGLAAGIDTAAHEATLAAGGRAVAVIGTGITRYFPAENRLLQRRIATDGLVISQFWPDAPPHKDHFPMRNAVMSGYAAATVVIEAGERSGARIQTRLALQQGRHVVLLRGLLANEWARKLVDRPGVAIVDGPDDLTSAVDRVLRARHDELAERQDLADVTIA